MQRFLSKRVYVQKLEVHMTVLSVLQTPSSAQLLHEEYCRALTFCRREVELFNNDVQTLFNQTILNGFESLESLLVKINVIQCRRLCYFDYPLLTHKPVLGIALYKLAHSCMIMVYSPGFCHVFDIVQPSFALEEGVLAR